MVLSSPTMPTMHEQMDTYAKHENETEQIIISRDMRSVFEQKQESDREEKNDERYPRAPSQK